MFSVRVVLKGDNICFPMWIECENLEGNFGGCLIDNMQISWDDVLSWCVRELINDSMKAVLRRLGLGVAVHHILKHRNDIKHVNQIRS